MAESTKSRRERRRELRRLRSRKHNPDGTMTLVQHIYEFRRRLSYALLAIVAGGILGFIWFEQPVGPIPSLGELIRGPYCALPDSMLADFAGDGECRLLQTKPFEVFMIRLKVGIAAGAVLLSPVWLYQFWAFVAPGLYERERKYGRAFVSIATVLFVIGAALAYILVPVALRMLVGFGGDNFATALTGDDYISFIITLLVIFGVSFEIPLLIIMLNRAGVLSYEQLSRWRRGLIMALFVFAAIVTPADPFSMLALALALTLLFEAAIQVARLHDRKRAKKRKELGWDDVPDDEAAPFEYTPSGPQGEDVT
ncbi:MULTISPECIES: twin-arginine translocase subunit TatC [Thermocrispum]|uniref:Sec-independent protein translocase protein TatC n=2 Tax=Thermocrispum agreste TaxID=37925 RepID=A0ABD6FBI0_9PSEU|nr:MULTISPECIES: twin-arginine translocase subunit TatC [Thermocrispum]